MRFFLAFCIMVFNSSQSIWSLSIGCFLCLWKIADILDDIRKQRKPNIISANKELGEGS